MERRLLDKLIADAPADQAGALEAQITLRATGRQFAGAIKAVLGCEGLYEVLTVGVRPSEAGSRGEPVLIKCFFAAEDVESVEVPWSSPSVIATSDNSRIVLPGRH